jgi:hypothetical protein
MMRQFSACRLMRVAISVNYSNTCQSTKFGLHANLILNGKQPAAHRKTDEETDLTIPSAFLTALLEAARIASNKKNSTHN